ncbi:MAG TPA: hypothetical protein VN875_20490 [Candidatus Binatus sp.]|nr:hypothetical protein [Candidatus Binatus sp.]
MSVGLAVLVAMATVWNLLPLFAAARTQTAVPDIAARARLFPGLGPGLRAIKRDSSGRYYILAAPASTVSVYGADGKRIGEIPTGNSQAVKIVFAEDIDIDATNRLFIADRGANAVKIFQADGSLDTSVTVLAPTSVAALPGNEFAVTSLRSDLLVTIYSEQGKRIRGFGAPGDLPASADSKRYIDRGRLSGDSLGFIYFAFTFVPDATIRKYDRFGYSAYEISLPHPDEQSASSSQTPGVDILALARRNQGAAVKPVIKAFGVDPVSQDVWMQTADLLSHFDKNGAFAASYRTAAANGIRLEPSAILIEPNRILLAVDPLGVYEFSRPDKQNSESTGRR